jgi:phospholipid-translocating ATPase
MPITVIVLITAVKDALEDWKRRNSDREINNSKCSRLGNVENLNYIGFSLPWQKQLWLEIKAFPQTVLVTLKRSFRLIRSKLSPTNTGTTTSQNSNGDIPMQNMPARINIIDEFGQTRLAKSPVSSVRSRTETSPNSMSVSSTMSSPVRTIVSDPNDPKAPKFRSSVWKSIRVGDIVCLKNNQTIPADVVILATSEADSLCYIETKNLDGETNLKIRNGFNELSWMKTADDAASLKCELHTEAPNNNLYSFKGYMILPIEGPPVGDGTQGESSLGTEKAIIRKNLKLPISINELLLRGCIMRNTDWAIGIVVYTGADTKLIMNSGETPSKRSMIEKQMNPQVCSDNIPMQLHSLLCVYLQIRCWQILY